MGKGSRELPNCDKDHMEKRLCRLSTVTPKPLSCPRHFLVAKPGSFIPPRFVLPDRGGLLACTSPKASQGCPDGKRSPGCPACRPGLTGDLAAPGLQGTIELLLGIEVFFLSSKIVYPFDLASEILTDTYSIQLFYHFPQISHFYYVFKS